MRPVSTNLNEGKYKLYTGHSQCTYFQMLDGIYHTDSLSVLQELGNHRILVTLTTLSLYAKQILESILAQFFTQKTVHPIHFK